jgi:hypothetical protein
LQPDSLGLPGDNLNLYAVLQVFQESPTLEEFEQKLNSEETNINNLDLDGDGYIDFIQVEDYVAGETHSIVLKVAVSATEWQDVAVIQVERLAPDRVQIQAIGDEELYGTDYIIEPYYDTASEEPETVTPNPGYLGPTGRVAYAPDGRTITIYKTTTIEIARWPIIRKTYLRLGRSRFSPWYYSHYPPWWRPWRVHFWHYYWGYHYHHFHHYFGHYRRWQHYRSPGSHRHYYVKFRSAAPIVSDRKRTGAFAETYTRPDLRNDGIARYDKLHPGGSQTTTRSPGSTPSTKEVEKSRPAGRTRPAATRPSDTRATRPATSEPSTKEVERSKPAGGTTPAATRPSDTRTMRPAAPRPSTKEVERSKPAGGTTPAATRPSDTRTTRPATPKPPTKEVERSKPAESTTPAATRPADTRATRPAPAKTPATAPPVEKPVREKPSPRP